MKLNDEIKEEHLEESLEVEECYVDDTSNIPLSISYIENVCIEKSNDYH